MKGTENNFLTAKAVDEINEILSREKEAVLSFRKNKSELIIKEQATEVKNKINITSE